MKERELRKRCRKLLNQLDIGPPLDVELLCERLGGRRGKPIRLMAYPLEVPGPFGCWIATSSADYIFYQASAINGYDATGHYLRAGLLVNSCVTYSVQPVSG